MNRRWSFLTSWITCVLLAAPILADGPAGSTPRREKPPLGPPAFIKPAEPPLYLHTPVGDSAAARKEVLDYIHRLPADKQPACMALLDVQDQQKLEDTARDDAEPAVREAATQLLVDQKLLAKLAWESGDEHIRWSAVQRITGEDQPSVVQLVEKTTDGNVRRVALSKIRDAKQRVALMRQDFKPRPGTLAEVAPRQNVKTGNDVYDILSITDPARLRAIAMDETEPTNARTAAAQLRHLAERGSYKDAEAMADIAMHAKSAAARSEMVVTIRDPKVLAQACKDTDASVRSAAGVYVTDQAVLSQLALDKDVLVRRSVVNRLTDLAVLRRVAAGDSDVSIRAVAAARVRELEHAKR